jgi:hypothetical protein
MERKWSDVLYMHFRYGGLGPSSALSSAHPKRDEKGDRIDDVDATY